MEWNRVHNHFVFAEKYELKVWFTIAAILRYILVNKGSKGVRVF